ncbi:HAD hydrolase-like protein [Salinispora sp. H7-4]|uniref:HAD family hydrolase n=1 Tax=Salinispora sp. H7-4 TaxID=2748321 RepID=UPI0015D428A3|nr:HAD hydrolase-like protein [Salinispora sp. H7-4]NYT96081.1 haloacid dehalogenase-like hydrolase [Salinispora sp. H7-4]
MTASGERTASVEHGDHTGRESVRGAPGVAGPLLVLWDIDGTLIDNGGVSKEAYTLTFTRLTGRLPEHPIVPAGRTDPAVLRLLLRQHGIEATPDVMEQAVGVMNRVFESLRSRLAERGHAEVGAPAAIAALARRSDVVQSVLTGNTWHNAQVKVSVFGLAGALDYEVGAYGSDTEVRADLVSVARRKATAKYGISYPPAPTVLIGDTPRDIRAGRSSGAFAVAVATGRYGVEALAASGADAVLPDLRDTSAVVDAVLGAWRDRSGRPTDETG